MFQPLIGLIVFMMSFVIHGQVVAQTTTIEKATLKTESPEKVQLTLLEGVYEIRGTDEKFVSYEVEKNDFTHSCKIVVTEKNQMINMTVKRVGGFKKSKCITNFKIYLPKSIDLKVFAQSGNLQISDTIGKLDLNQKAGILKVNSQIKDLNLSIASANADIVGLEGSAKINTTRGKVHVVITKHMNEAVINVTSASGDISIEVPKGVEVSRKVMGLKSHLKFEIDNAQKSPVNLIAKIGLGKLYLKRTEVTEQGVN